MWFKCGIILFLQLANFLAQATLDSLPRITLHPTDVVVKTGSPAAFVCEAEGDPLPAITWYKDGGPVETIYENAFSHRVLIPESATRLKLLFHTIIHTEKNKPDEGIYYCNATNGHGSAISRTASLRVANWGFNLEAGTATWDDARAACVANEFTLIPGRRYKAKLLTRLIQDGQTVWLNGWRAVTDFEKNAAGKVKSLKVDVARKVKKGIGLLCETDPGSFSVGNVLAVSQPEASTICIDQGKSLAKLTKEDYVTAAFGVMKLDTPYWIEDVIAKKTVAKLCLAARLKKGKLAYVYDTCSKEYSYACFQDKREIESFNYLVSFKMSVYKDFKNEIEEKKALTTSSTQPPTTSSTSTTTTTTAAPTTTSTMKTTTSTTPTTTMEETTTTMKTTTTSLPPTTSSIPSTSTMPASTSTTTQTTTTTAAFISTTETASTTTETASTTSETASTTSETASTTTETASTTTETASTTTETASTTTETASTTTETASTTPVFIAVMPAENSTAKTKLVNESSPTPTMVSTVLPISSSTTLPTSTVSITESTTSKSPVVYSETTILPNMLTTESASLVPNMTTSSPPSKTPVPLSNATTNQVGVVDVSTVTSQTSTKGEQVTDAIVTTSDDLIDQTDQTSTQNVKNVSMTTDGMEGKQSTTAINMGTDTSVLSTTTTEIMVKNNATVQITTLPSNTVELTTDSIISLPDTTLDIDSTTTEDIIADKTTQVTVTSKDISKLSSTGSPDSVTTVTTVHSPVSSDSFSAKTTTTNIPIMSTDQETKTSDMYTSTTDTLISIHIDESEIPVVEESEDESGEDTTILGGDTFPKDNEDGNTAESTKTGKGNSSNDDWELPLIIALIVMAVAVLLALLLAVYLHRRRKIQKEKMAGTEGNVELRAKTSVNGGDHKERETATFNDGAYDI